MPSARTTADGTVPDMERISPLLRLLAEGSTHRGVQQLMLELTDDDGYGVDYRMALGAALARNRHLHPDVRDRLGRHGWSSVRKQLLRTGTVSVDEARRWFPDEQRHTVASALVTFVNDPTGTLAAELGARLDNPRLDAAIIKAAHLPLAVQLAAAARLASRAHVPASHLRLALGLATRSRACERALRAATTPDRWGQYAPPIPAPVETLPRRYRDHDLLGWLASSPRPLAEVLEAASTCTSPKAAAALARSYPDPTGEVGDLLVARWPDHRAVLTAVLEGPRRPAATQKSAALALVGAPRGASTAARLKPLLVALGNTDTAFADRFYEAAVAAGDYGWLTVAHAWPHLGAQALTAGAELLLTEDCPVGWNDVRVQHVMWSANTPTRVKARVAAWYRALWQRAAAGQTTTTFGPYELTQSARYARLFDASAAAGTDGVPQLAAADVAAIAHYGASAALPDQVVRALGIGPDDDVSHGQLTILNALVGGSEAPLADLAAAAAAVGA